MAEAILFAHVRRNLLSAAAELSRVDRDRGLVTKRKVAADQPILSELPLAAIAAASDICDCCYGPATGPFSGVCRFCESVVICGNCVKTGKATHENGEAECMAFKLIEEHQRKRGRQHQQLALRFAVRVLLSAETAWGPGTHKCGYLQR